MLWTSGKPTNRLAGGGGVAHKGVATEWRFCPTTCDMVPAPPNHQERGFNGVYRPLSGVF